MLVTFDKTETNIEQAQQFTVHESAAMFSILSDKLYSDAKTAIVRELLTNAYDSHVVANTLNKPISITFPSVINKYFEIRDYGTGLSNEDIFGLYSTFFSSTKDSDNTLTGGFGLGSKTPFAYSDIFNVTSYFNGLKSIFICFKKDGVPNLTLISTEETTEDNGISITIPVDSEEKDTKTFLKITEQYLKFHPEIKTNLDINYPTNTNIVGFNFLSLADYEIDLPILFHEDKTNSYRSYGYWLPTILIKQGQNIFNISSSYFLTSEIEEVEHKIYDIIQSIQLTSYGTLYFEVPIGTLLLTPNREGLLDIESNKQYLQNLFTSFINKLLYMSIKDLKNLPNKNLYYKHIFKKYKKFMYTDSLSIWNEVNLKHTFSYKSILDILNKTQASDIYLILDSRKKFTKKSITQNPISLFLKNSGIQREFFLEYNKQIYTIHWYNYEIDNPDNYIEYSDYLDTITKLFKIINKIQDKVTCHIVTKEQFLDIAKDIVPSYFQENNNSTILSRPSKLIGKVRVGQYTFNREIPYNTPYETMMNGEDLENISTKNNNVYYIPKAEFENFSSENNYWFIQPVTFTMNATNHSLFTGKEIFKILITNKNTEKYLQDVERFDIEKFKQFTYNIPLFTYDMFKIYFLAYHYYIFNMININNTLTQWLHTYYLQWKLHRHYCENNNIFYHELNSINHHYFKPYTNHTDSTWKLKTKSNSIPLSFIKLQWCNLNTAYINSWTQLDMTNKARLFLRRNKQDIADIRRLAYHKKY